MSIRLIAPCLFAFALVGILSTLARGVEPEKTKVRVLLITGGHGFEEKPFFGMFASFPGIETKHVPYPEAADLLKPSLTDTYDVIVFYDLWRKGLTDQQKRDFVALLEKGIGVVALHHTLAAHPDWTEYQTIIGGRYHLQDRTVDGKTIPMSTYAHGETLNVTIADKEHPITQGIQDFKIQDETYHGYDTDPKAHLLLTTDNPKNDPELAWVKPYKDSRVFYLMLGHDHLAYANPSYRTLVEQGIRWAAN